MASKDKTKYNFNGQEDLGKRALVKEIVLKYISDNPRITYKELQEFFDGIKPTNSIPVLFNKTDYTNWKKDKKDSQERHFEPIKHNGDKLYIANNWGKDTIEPLINLVKEKLEYDITPVEAKEDKITNQEKNKKNNNETFSNPTFTHKNLLLKGVPGTGKSRTIENIIKDELKLENHKENILRINIHSASSNADLMQGIGISSNDGQIVYKEKQGLILNLIRKATFNPNQPFVLILEEIQENSLNELIGDLIYLIEDNKRAKNITIEDGEYEYQELIEKIIENNPETDYVEIPYLIKDSTVYRKMIMPDNLYIFCTSNYRDDKKVIEDNLLRRFEVLEIYPKYKKSIGKEFKSQDVSDFLEALNANILTVLEDEIHPDRFLIGHSNWLKVECVESKEDFYRAFLKVVVEFKDIKEVEFEDFKKIVEPIGLPENLNFNLEKSYKELIEDLQIKAGYEFLNY